MIEDGAVTFGGDPTGLAVNEAERREAVLGFRRMT